MLGAISSTDGNPWGCGRDHQCSTCLRSNVRGKCLRPTLRTDIRWGLAWARWFVLGYSTLAIVIYAVRPLLTEQPPPFPLYRVLLAYIGGGAAGGLMLGTLRPMARSRAGSIVLGIIVALPVYYGFAIAAVGFTQFSDPVSVTAVSILGMIVGAYGGAMSHSGSDDRKSRSGQ